VTIIKFEISADGVNVECTLEVPGGLPAPDPDVLPTTLTVTDGVASHKIKVGFDVSTGIEEGLAQVLFPGTPAVTMTMTKL